MHLLYSIDWQPSPEIFHIGGLSVRWYGFFFLAGFVIGLKLMERMFAHERVNKEWLDPLFFYVIFATLIGARLGHVFFYGWEYFQHHLIEIILPIRHQIGASMFWGLIKDWKFIGYAGLASHGGAIGIIIALWLFSKKISKKPVLWILDRIVVPTALAGAFIRLGNLMNSEIIGSPTDLPWGFRFLLSGVENPELPRHPSQLYESLCYFATFITLMYLYWKTSAKDKLGYLLGVFFVMVFASRFLIEFVKENQEAFEEGMMLNMGQWLSIPFILIGVYLIVRNRKKV